MLNYYIVTIVLVIILTLICSIYSRYSGKVRKIVANSNYEVFIPETYLDKQMPYDILVVITNCFETKDFNPRHSNFPAIVLHCSKETNWKDSREGGLMLLFIHFQRKYHFAKKYIFIHDHNTSWHYSTDIWERINYIVETKYFKNHEYGPLYCQYYFPGGNKYDNFTTEKIRPVYNAVDSLNLTIPTPDDLIREKYTIPCCSAFFIDSSVYDRFDDDYFINLFMALRNHTISGYIKYKQKYHEKVVYINWVNGVFLEFFWSTMLGYKNVTYPPNCPKIEPPHW